MSYRSLQQIVELLHMDILAIRRLEREGLVEPELGEGGDLLYSDEQIFRLRLARDLTELGVNDEGIEVILTMRERMIAMQRTTRELLELMQQRDREPPPPASPKTITVRIL